MKGSRTAFLGYEETQSESKILKLIRGDEIVPFAQRRGRNRSHYGEDTLLRRTGGQVGDRGVIFHEDFSLGGGGHHQRPMEDVIVHQAKVKRGG